MSQYATENNKPNAKVIAGSIAAFVSIALAYFLSSRGIVIPQDSINENVAAVMGGVLALRTIVEYFWPPSKGDGVKQKP